MVFVVIHLVEFPFRLIRIHDVLGRGWCVRSLSTTSIFSIRHCLRSRPSLYFALALLSFCEFRSVRLSVLGQHKILCWSVCDVSRGGSGKSLLLARLTCAA